MDLIERLRDRARTVGASVVLPESEDPRILAAAAQLARELIVRPILLGEEEKVRRAAKEVGLDLPRSVAILDPCAAHDVSMVQALRDLESSAGIPLDVVAEQLRDSLTFAAMLVRTGRADGCVAGAVHDTRRVLQTALRVIGLEDGVQVVSSVFLMVLPEGRALTFADCAVVPDPNAAQLAGIAVASARTHRRLTGEAPCVALLSFSTKGSAEHECVRKVQTATDLARQMAPEIAMDGELQFDAAYVEAVGARKAPGSCVAGRANVFIFPNLDAGNIAYKITERLARAEAIGPLLQGLAKPMHDLSRGCKPDDVVTAAAICALQVQQRERLGSSA